jgi:hypothetical protein
MRLNSSAAIAAQLRSGSASAQLTSARIVTRWLDGMKQNNAKGALSVI